jgi:hypothetical protein
MSDVLPEELRPNPESQDPSDFPGFHGEEPPETDDPDEETMPLATAALLGARDLLEPGGNEGPGPHQVSEATALALTSIAATLHDLSVLIEDEYPWRQSQRPVQGTDVEESEPEGSAHRSLGPGEDPGFSFSGR